MLRQPAGLHYTVFRKSQARLTSASASQQRQNQRSPCDTVELGLEPVRETGFNRAARRRIVSIFEEPDITKTRVSPVKYVVNTDMQFQTLNLPRRIAHQQVGNGKAGKPGLKVAKIAA